VRTELESPADGIEAPLGYRVTFYVTKPRALLSLYGRPSAIWDGSYNTKARMLVEKIIAIALRVNTFLVSM
jgi:hypothetical protein